MVEYYRLSIKQFFVASNIISMKSCQYFSDVDGADPLEEGHQPARLIIRNPQVRHLTEGVPVDHLRVGDNGDDVVPAEPVEGLGHVRSVIAPEAEDGMAVVAVLRPWCISVSGGENRRSSRERSEPRTPSPARRSSARFSKNLVDFCNM